MDKNNIITPLSDYGEVEVDINKIMKERKLSKTQLAKKSGIHHNTITKYINKEITQLDLNVLARLCYVLQCDLDDIVIYRKSKNDKN